MQEATKNKRTQKVGLIIFYLSGPLFIAFINPNDLPIIFLVLPFIWLFAALFIASTLLMKRVKGINHRQSVAVASVTATLPVLLLVFQSINQLSVRDVLLALGIVAITALYVLRADFIK